MLKEKITKRLRKEIELIYSILCNRWCRTFIGLIILLGTTSVIIQSFDLNQEYNYYFQIISFVCAFIFTIEYILRIISAPMEYPQYNSIKARLMYLISFM